MRQVWLVFQYTFKDAVRKKAFIISTVIMLAVVLALCFVPRIASLFSAEEEDISAAEPAQAASVCYYVDGQSAVPGGIEALAAAIKDTRFIAGNPEDKDAYKDEISGDSSKSLVEVSLQDGAPAIMVTTKDFMSGISSTAVSEALTKAYVSGVLAQKGLDEQTIALAQTELPVGTEAVGNMNISGYAIGIMLTLLIFFAIYYYGYGVSMSVATEKTSRVMETLVVSAKPSKILIGKVLAMGALGLLQFAGILLFGAGCYSVLVPGDFSLFGMPLTLSAFTVPSALLIVLYFILGYTLYAVMNSVCGATVSKIEDLNSAMMPVMLIALLSFYLGYFSALSSGSSGLLQKIAMYVPFSSPFIMPFKLLNGDVAAMDVVISVALLIVAIIAITAVSIRIYSASVLHYGNRMKLKDLYRAKI